MRKILALFVFALFLTTSVFSQSHKSVELESKIYKIIDYAALKGYISSLPFQKPYTNQQIKNAIYEIFDSDYELSDYEVEIFNEYLEKIKNLNKKDESKKNNVLHSRLKNSDESEIPVTFVYDFSLAANVSGGLYTKTDYSQFGFDIIPQLDFSGDVSKYLSWNFNALGSIARMPLIELGDYDCGQSWYTYQLDEKGNYVLDSEGEKLPIEKIRKVKKFINTSYLPYNYFRPWDAKVYYVTNLSTTGLEGWPQELSLCLNMTGEIRTSFFDDKLNIGFGRIYREVAGMDNGSSLVLNAKARPFTALDMQVSPFKFLRYSFIVGSLEYPSQAYMNENWYPENTGSNDDSFFFQNNYTLNMVDLDFEHLHIDFGSSVVWPNRLAMGYMFPLANFVEYQNHVGDADNLQMFGDIKLKYQGLGEIWASMFLDELDLSTLLKKDVFTYTRDMFAYQFGFKYVIPKLPFATLSLRYTKIEPYCYTHQSINYTPWFNHYISQNYTNDGYNIGYYLDPNSDELRLDFNIMPKKNLNLAFTYQFIRHGADYGSQQVPGSSLYSELDPRGRAERRKYFLHDGAYNWMHIVNFGSEFTLSSKYPVTFTTNLGFVYSYYSMIAQENYTTDGKAENCDFSTPISVVNTKEYPQIFGAVLSLGVKVVF